MVWQCLENRIISDSTMSLACCVPTRLLACPQPIIKITKDGELIAIPGDLPEVDTAANLCLPKIISGRNGRQDRDGDNDAGPLNCPTQRRVFAQRQVRADLIVVRSIRRENLPQVRNPRSIFGRPARFRDRQRQSAVNPARCQRRIVSG